MANKCIMPEMPYCPSCQHGIEVHEEWMREDECKWVCLLDTDDESDNHDDSTSGECDIRCLNNDECDGRCLSCDLYDSDSCPDNH